ncbi:MAG: hypothetical protein IJK75_02395 [Bacteroidales bacterium]|nr:hypothetical protein [Bacteroidales bacterium]
MKRSILFIAMGALVLLSACTKDPWDQISEGSWNQDRKILNIKFAGQAGLAKVTEVDESTGIIDVQLATNLVADMSSVEVSTLELSYNATSSVQLGGKLDFTGAAPTITVTSATGKSRVYTINMTEFTETILGCYAITSSMVWGGTGPEWGGGALMEPSTKSWCWYMDEGHGPNAEYDDYLEFTLDEIRDDGNTTGKCIHYGGVDGKHWNCLFKAAVNKEGDTDIDLHKFYRQIPIGESTWVRDYVNNTISFIDANGKTTTGQFLPSGDYTVYEGKVLTVEKNAFGFNLSGVDDWTNIYSDYDKFVKRPRIFFVLVTPVDQIPAASKTEGTEGKNSVEPPAPAPVFDLPGNWKVKEQWVYGGAAGAITKDQTTAKSWCWNGNYVKEKDNILTFTPSQEGGLSGTAFYGPGADGGYWDYMYVGKKAGVAVSIDCSQWYGWLPHTETSYTFNPDDITEQSPCGTVTIRISSVVTYNVPILLPGSYEFLGKSALVIPEGCMALALPLADAPSNDHSYEWTDYDRFVNSPLLYVMVFEKQVPAE